MDFTRMQELLQSRQYSLLKKELSKEQNVDIAEFLDELDARCTLLVFRLLPKEIAADVFSHLSAESQAQLSVLVNEQELRDILDDLKFDDKIDFLEEVPANVVKRILKHSTETERKLINKFLNYPEDSAGSLMAIEFVELKKRDVSF